MAGYNNSSYDGFQLNDYAGNILQPEGLFNYDSFNFNTKAAPGILNQGAGSQGPGGVKPGNEGFSLGDWTKLGTGVADAYLGYENLQLAKDSFNKNLANQAQLINNQMRDREVARRGFSGGSTLKSDLDAYLEPKKVSGQAV